jgi:hypothetical protein
VVLASSPTTCVAADAQLTLHPVFVTVKLAPMQLPAAATVVACSVRLKSCSRQRGAAMRSSVQTGPEGGVPSVEYKRGSLPPGQFGSEDTLALWGLAK